MLRNYEDFLRTEQKMNKRFKGASAKVCVAVNFDQTSDRVLQVAQEYCSRTGAQMHLVHVVENHNLTDWATIAAGELVLSDVMQYAQEQAVEKTEKKLFELSKSMKTPIKTSTKVLAGDIASDLIEAEALASQSGLIITGANPGSHRFVPRGMSCALSLMGNSKIPVMVVSTNQESTLSGDRLSMIIADDMREHSDHAVLAGCDLAFALNKTDIHHIHINGLTVDTLKAALDQATASSHAQATAGLNARDVYTAAIKQLESRLEERTKNVRIPLEVTACKYNRELVSGSSVTDTLQNYAEKKKADLAVFGRHKTFHKRPLIIGQMPYYAMLALRCPVVVIPSK
jgi:nucleotide-binding universal stress UspA family protein